MEGEYLSIETTKRIADLEKRYNELSELYATAVRKKIELSQIRRKAIEYITNNLCDNKARVKENISGKQIDKLIEILEGEKNEGIRNV